MRVSPNSRDFTLGEGPDHVWAIYRGDKCLVTLATKDLAVRTVHALARLEGCAAWSVSDDAEPVLLKPPRSLFTPASRP